MSAWRQADADQRTGRSGRSIPARWILTALRYGLCVAAILFLYRSVPWHDRVRLNDGPGTLVRLIKQHGDEFTIQRDPATPTETVPAEAIRFVEVAGQRIPDIEVGIPRAVLETDHGLALWSILIFAPVPFLAALRLVWMLAIQQVRLSLWNATKLTFAGNFFNFALPGTTGGDLIKAYYITRFTRHKTEAVTTVFLDRAVGLLSLVLMAGAMIAFTRDPSQFARLGLTLVAICAVLGAGAAIVFSRRIRRRLRLRELVALLPMSAQLERVGAATLAMRNHKLLVLAALLITFVLQGIAMVSAAIMAWALHMQGTFAYFFIYVAIGFLIAAIPSTPQAIGVMESAYVLFFTYNGENSASQALALALAVRLIQLIWSLPGVLVPLLGAHLPNRAELAELEQAPAPRPGGAGPAPESVRPAASSP